MTEPDVLEEVIEEARQLSVGRVLSLFGYAFSSLADIGMLVAGTGLVGLSIAILRDGFGAGTPTLTDNTGALLGSALIIGVFGIFALGVAFEGPVGHGRLSQAVGAVELSVARAASALLVGLIGVTVAGILRQFFGGLPDIFLLATDVIGSAGRAGMIFVLLIAVPTTLLLRYRYQGQKWMEEAELPVFYLIWLFGAMFFMSASL